MAETLNLVNSDDELSCKYEISKFPDGQQSLRIIEPLNGFHTLKDQTILIKSRLNTFQDLELIICANQALKEIGVKSVKLYIPYCIGGRSDRKFQAGGINYIKTVIAPIINSQNFDEVRVTDPHSDVLEACINNFAKHNNYDLIHTSLKDIYNEDIDDKDKVCLVSPDAGAYKKIFDVAKFFKIKNIITASKVRDLDTGNILKTEIPLIDNNDNMKYVIVDDICDGGRTFIELAKVIKEQKPDAEIYLIVTHGIFSAGFGELNNYFKKIFTTNSIKQHENSQLKQVNLF